MSKNIKKVRPRKTIKIADLENFEVFAYAPCYKRLSVEFPDYFIDTDTGEAVGQNIFLAKLPDGTLERSHYKVVVVEKDKVEEFIVRDEDFLDIPWGD